MDPVQNVLTDANLLDHIFNCIEDDDAELAARALAHWGEGVNHTIKRACADSRDAAWAALYAKHFKRMLEVDDNDLRERLSDDGQHPGAYVARLAHIKREGALHEMHLLGACNSTHRSRRRLERALNHKKHVTQFSSLYWCVHRHALRPASLADLTSEEVRSHYHADRCAWKMIVTTRRCRAQWRSTLKPWERFAYHAFERARYEDLLAALP